MARAPEIHAIVHGIVAEMGGSISAEHGIGRYKRELLRREERARARPDAADQAGLRPERHSQSGTGDLGMRPSQADCGNAVLLDGMRAEPKTKAAQPLMLTPELVALTIRADRGSGSAAGVTYFGDDADYDAILAETLARAPDGDIWLFAFGSLIWKPACDFVEERIGTARGWHRAFRLGWDHPLARHGRAAGTDDGARSRRPVHRHALPAAAGDVEESLGALLRREMPRSSRRRQAGTQRRWLTVETAGGPVTAMAFVLNRGGPGLSRPAPA